MDPQVLHKAKLHLARRDAVIKPVIRAVGPCTLRCEADHFDVLVRSIISQQISTRAALAIANRLREAVGRFQPRRILEASDDTLRQAGLSQGKRLSLRDLASKCSDGTVPLKKLADLDDADVVETLVKVRGIGPWTAEMFLIFSLGRMDVLPVGDYGLQAGMQKLHALAELPKKARLHELTESWKPYRSIGTWYVWRSLGGVPQSD